MQVRRFGADVKVKIPGGHPGLYGMLIAMNRDFMRASHPDLDAFAARVHGLPFALDAPVIVEAMYFEPHGRMDEHSAPHPILFLAIDGAGTVRVGGPDGETHAVTAGDAVLWPAGIDHTVWTGDAPLAAVVVNLLREPPNSGDPASPA